MQKVLNRLPRLEVRTWLMISLLFLIWLKPFVTVFSNVAVTFFIIPCSIVLFCFMLRKKRISIDVFSITLMLSVAFLVIADVKNGEFSLASLARLGTISIYMLAIGLVPKDMSREAIRAERLTVMMTYVCLMLPLFILVVVSFFIGRPIRLPSADGYIGIEGIGAIESRIRVLCHPNVAARDAVGCMLFCIYGFYSFNKRWVKAILGLAFVVFAFALIHAQCRTCNLMISIALGAMAFRWIYLRLNGKTKGVVAGIAVGLVVILLIMSLISMLFGFNVKIVSANNPIITDELTGELRGGKAGALDVFDNGRDYIWKNGMTYLCEHPSNFVIGMGTGDIMEKIVAETEPWLSDAWKPHLHNSYLEALARGGIPLVACILVFLVFLIKPCMLMLTDGDNRGDRGAHILPILVGILLINGITEELLFTSIRTFNLFFYFAAGHIMYEYGRMKEAKQEKLLQK